MNKELKIKVVYNDGAVIFLDYMTGNLEVVKSAFANGSIKLYGIVKAGY